MSTTEIPVQYSSQTDVIPVVALEELSRAFLTSETRGADVVPIDLLIAERANRQGANVYQNDFSDGDPTLLEVNLRDNRPQNKQPGEVVDARSYRQHGGKFGLEFGRSPSREVLRGVVQRRLERERERETGIPNASRMATNAPGNPVSGIAKAAKNRRELNDRY